MPLTLIDCTLRDGGHLNDWQFDLNCAKASYFAAIKSGVDYFEIGYRFPQGKKGFGEFAYCNDEFLAKNFKPEQKCKLLIMADAGKAEPSQFEKFNSEFTPVRGIRIAAYPYEYDKAFSLLYDLRNKGYTVFLNLMAFSTINDAQYEQLQKWDSKEVLSAIYFADSFGSYTPKDIAFYYEKLKQAGYDEIGFHAHNNLQLSFANALTAIQIGCKFIDGSIFGMGRGAGNLPIEAFIGYLLNNGMTKYNPVPYLDVIDRFYSKMYRDIGWGYTLQSVMGGLKNLHPYYVDEMFSRKIYTINEIWNTLDTVKEKCPISFSSEKMDLALEDRLYKPLSIEKTKSLLNELLPQLKIIPENDSFVAPVNNYTGIKNGKKAIVICNGASIIKYKDQIDEFIKTQNCFTIGVNYLKDLYHPDYHLFVSRKRFLKYVHSVNNSSILTIPSFFGRKMVEENFSGNTLYYNIQSVEPSDGVIVRDGIQSIEFLNVGISAILLAYQMGADDIYVVGMDGYLSEDNKKDNYFYNEDDIIEDKTLSTVRYETMSKELDKLNDFLQNNNIHMSIITPTSRSKYFRNILNANNE